MSATPVEMAEAQDFPKSAFVVLLEDYRALERQLAEAKGTQIGWMVEGTYNGEEISRTLFALEDREFADLFKENNGGVVKPIYDAPTQMKRSLEPQASAEDRVMTDERKPDASSQPHARYSYNDLLACIREQQAALKKMDHAYVRLLEIGRDRLMDYGCVCDPLEVMEKSDIDLRDLRAVLAKWRIE